MLGVHQNPPEHVCKPPMVHLSSFCLNLELVTEPVEQYTCLMECNLDSHRCWGKVAVWLLQAISQLLHIDGLRWLTAEAIELARPSSLCIESLKGQAQAGWTLTVQQAGLWNITGRHGMRHRLQFSLGPSGCVAYMGGLTCPEIRLAIVPGGGVIFLLKFRKLLQSGQPIGIHLRHDTG